MTDAPVHTPRLAHCRACLVITEGDIELFARDCTTGDNAKTWARRWRDDEGITRYFGSPVVATIYDVNGRPWWQAELTPGDFGRIRWEWR